MGSAHSDSFASQPVVLPPSHCIPTINKRFVKDRVVTLELHDQFWTQPRDHDFIIRDVTTNQTVFKVGPVTEEDAAAQHHRRLLLDAYGVPVVGMERHDRPPVSAEYTVVPGGKASTSPLCTFMTQMVGGFQDPLVLEFNDPVSGRLMILGTQGFWQARDAVLTITRDARLGSAVYCFARIYCDGSPLDGVYKMDVAAGVDLAFVVMLAAALEEQTKKHVGTASRIALRRAVKEAEKRAQRQQKQQTTAAAKPGMAARAK